MTLKEIAILTKVDGLTFEYYGIINGIRVVVFDVGGKTGNLSVREVTEDKEGELNALIEKNRPLFTNSGNLKKSDRKDSNGGPVNPSTSQAYFDFGS